MTTFLKDKETFFLQSICLINGLIFWAAGSYFLALGLFITIGTIYGSVTGTDATGLGIIIGPPIILIGCLFLIGLRSATLLFRSRYKGRLSLIIILILSISSCLFLNDFEIFLSSAVLKTNIILNLISLIYLLNPFTKYTKNEIINLDSNDNLLLFIAIFLLTALFLFLKVPNYITQ